MRLHLYKRPCPSVRWSVRPSVGNAFVKFGLKGNFTDSNDLDSAGRGRKRGEEEEEGGTMRREEGTRRVKKNEKVA